MKALFILLILFSVVLSIICVGKYGKNEFSGICYGPANSSACGMSVFIASQG